MYFDNKMYGESIHELESLCNLKAGDVFVDCGANLGQEIDFFNGSGIIFDSYEPHPYFYNKIIKRFGDNPNVTINNLAVWINDETLNFFFKKPVAEWGDNHRSGGASLVRKTNHRGEMTSVKCIDIVDIINKHEKIKILKIDIEGAEYKVIKRLIDTGLINKPEFIFFEDHERKIVNNPEFLSDKKDVQEFVNNTDFKFYNW